MLIIITILLAMTAGQAVFEQDQEDNITRSIENLTAPLEWNSTDFEPPMNDFSNSSTIVNIVYKTCDWLGYTMFEIGKWGMGFGYENPQYDFEFFMNIGIKLVYLLLIIPVIPAIVIAIGAIIMALYLLTAWIYKKVKK